MKIPRRRLLHLAAGAAALPAVSRIATAQSYPTRPVRIIVGFPAGGSTRSLLALPITGACVPCPRCGIIVEAVPLETTIRA